MCVSFFCVGLLQYYTLLTFPPKLFPTVEIWITVRYTTAFNWTKLTFLYSAVSRQHQQISRTKQRFVRNKFRFWSKLKYLGCICGHAIELWCPMKQMWRMHLFREWQHCFNKWAKANDCNIPFKQRHMFPKMIRWLKNVIKNYASIADLYSWVWEHFEQRFSNFTSCEKQTKKGQKYC